MWDSKWNIDEIVDGLTCEIGNLQISCKFTKEVLQRASPSSRGNIIRSKSWPYQYQCLGGERISKVNPFVLLKPAHIFYLPVKFPTKKRQKNPINFTKRRMNKGEMEWRVTSSSGIRPENLSDGCYCLFSLQPKCVTLKIHLDRHSRKITIIIIIKDAIQEKNAFQKWKKILFLPSQVRCWASANMGLDLQFLEMSNPEMHRNAPLETQWKPLAMPRKKRGKQMQENHASR